MIRIRQALAGLVGLGLCAMSVTAQAAIGDAPEYKLCLDRIEVNADTAFEEALAWRDRGGGLPARHCAALALVAMRKYGPAAERLERLAESPAGAGMRVALLGQAGNAWLLAQRPDRAYAVFSAALAALAPDSAATTEQAELHIDRARALAEQQQWADAEADLSKALAFDPTRADAYTFRATARRFQERMGLALEDVELALAIAPELPEALLERGILRRLAGQDDAARADWIAAISRDPEGPVAEAGRRNLELLDVQMDPVSDPQG